MTPAGGALLFPRLRERGLGWLWELQWQLCHRLRVSAPGTFSGCSAARIGSFPIVTLSVADVKEYFVPWHVYGNSSRLFSHSYEFL